MAASKRPAKAPAASAPPAVITILETMVPKKHSTRFETSAENPAFSNLYLSNAAFSQLGRPAKLKVTIEPAD